MFSKKFVIFITIITSLVIGGGVYLISKSGSPQLSVSSQAKAETTLTEHDWGEVGINNGHVTQSFMIKNIGSTNLNLANVSTSCMCTTAQVILPQGKSPFFGMHTQSSWLGELPPGQEAELVVDFDPAFHGPSGIGAITRQIVLETNDPQNSELTFTLSANVVN